MKRFLFMLISLLLVLSISYAEDVTVQKSIVDRLVLIPAREDFAFARDLTNTTDGEASPITEDYWLSSTKVTNAEYKAFTDATGHKAPNYWTNGTYPEGKADHPVIAVSYSDAIAYCEWLTAQHEGWTFRLPTEAEWENAARGKYYNDRAAKYPTDVSPEYDAETMSVTTDFNYNGVIASELMRTLGPDYIISYVKGDYKGAKETLAECISINANGGVTNWANHSGSASRGYFLETDVYAEISAQGGNTTPVGRYPANTLGLYDMAGNCWDLTCTVILANNGLEKGVACYAVRGGSWYATGRSCMMTYRGEGRRDHPSATVGFRVAADKAESVIMLPGE